MQFDKSGKIEHNQNWQKKVFISAASFQYPTIKTNELKKLDVGSIGDEDLGEVEFSEGIGAQLNHARNSLDALIFNIENKLYYNIDSHNIEFSIKYTSEDIDDRIIEWEVIDSAGFSVDPPFINSLSQQPYESNEGPIIPFSDIRTTNSSKIKRIQSY